MDRDDDIRWLVEHSMLAQGEEIRARDSGRGTLWQRPYAETQPRAVSDLASVWLSIYPASIITANGESVLHTLSDPDLWQALAHIGISGLHTGPMKRAGSVKGQGFGPTIDGHFDRIMLRIDPAYGSEQEYLAMSRNAKSQGLTLIGDVIPGHTGMGADFQLALRRYRDYAGLYHMVEIEAEDWPLLPEVKEGEETANLSAETVDILKEKGYIVGRLTRVIFYEPGVKETNWSATEVIRGVDDVERRWVYLHYFKAGQPSLNWLDPSFTAPKLISGDALHSLNVLGVGILRLDANGFLGIEPTAQGRAWSEGHPLSITANQLIAGMVRKAGGFTFQELNLTVDDIAAMSHGGADLSYDFITRPAYYHALVSGDTEFLRMMLATVHDYKIDPASLIHALQNHDELTLELVHFWTAHKDQLYQFQGRDLTGAELREEIRSFMYGRLTGASAPYNLKFVTNGVACTTVSLIAAALNINDLDNLTESQVTLIQQIHLLLAMYNALQPGILALSGWDLVGALPLPGNSVPDLIADGDTRWIDRGAYDLMDVDPTAQSAPSGLPKARSLYGSLRTQIQQKDSFLSRLQQIIAVRQRYRLHQSRQIEIPETAHKGLLLMVHALPDDGGIQVTALNFGSRPIEDRVRIKCPSRGPVTNMITGASEGAVETTGHLTIRLDGYAGKSLLIQ